MAISKKIIVSIGIVIILLLGAGGVFWWQNQKDVRELNKNLPEGVRVVKSLIWNEYKVVNRIDGYEFKASKEWGGINEIEYVPERTEEGYTAASIGIEGKEGGSRIVTIDRFKAEKTDIDLEKWAKTNFEAFGLVGNFEKDNVAGFRVVKTTEEVHLLAMCVYFFQKDLAIYAIVKGTEEFIRYIIDNGKW